MPVQNSQLYLPNQNTGDQEKHYLETNLSSIEDMTNFMKLLNKKGLNAEHIRAILGQSIETVPIGTILPYSANEQEPPASFLFCDGSAVSRSIYSELFNIIGTIYGEGDGSTTFNLPNLINKFIEGSATAGTSIAAGLPNISGTTTSFSGNNGAKCLVAAYASGAFTSNTQSGTLLTNNVSYSGNTYFTYDSFNASRSSSIYGNSTTVQPPSITTKFIIKAYHGASFKDISIDPRYAIELDKKLERQTVPAFNKLEKITTSGTFVAPVDGWYKITVKGGGGGGGASRQIDSGSMLSGGGGGEGGTAIAYEYMTAGDTATVVIGAGGTGASAGSANSGTAGGNSSVTVNGNTYTGGGGSGSGAYGGQGGTGTVPGDAGTPGCATYTSLFAYGGAGGGTGGATVGTLASSGAGGAGGIISSGSSGQAGGAGGDGFAWFEYFAEV